MKKISFAFVIALCVAGCTNTVDPLADKTPVKIGAIVPLTGAATTYGFPVQKAIDLRVSQINKAAGVGGQTFEIIWEDGKCSAADAAAAAEKLIKADGVQAIIGGVCSSETLGAAPLAESEKVVLMTPISKSPAIRDAGEYTFRLNVNSLTFGLVGGPKLSETFKNIATIIQQTDFAIGTEKGFADSYTGTLSSNQFQSDQSEFLPLIENIKAENPDAVLVAVQTLDKFTSLLADMTEANYTPNLIVNELIAGSPAMLTAMADYPAAIYSVLYVAPENNERDFFEQTYTETYNEIPTYGDATTFAIDAVDILTQIMKKNPTATGKEIKQELNEYTVTDGFAGTYMFDKNGEINVTPSLVLFNAESQKFEVAE